jgi:DNA-binding winged helix-turn-helix (wHTH) protein/Tfp pilus assembly protein PilF
MGESRHTGRIVRFGVYEVDRQACELRRGGQRIPLQIQPFRVLETLIDRAGEVVTRADLRARIWPSTVYVDFDHGLNNAINRLRHALGDSADAPRFIETLPRVGYRFIHALEQPEAEPRPPQARHARRAAAQRIGVAAAAAALVGLLGIGVIRWGWNENGLDGDAPTEGHPTASAQAYDAYLRGLELFEQRSSESVKLSIEHLKRATELDPSFAAAHAALAISYTSAGGRTLPQFLSTDEVLAPALAAAERALRLDPNLAQAHLALARVLTLQPWSTATDVAIERSYRRSLELDRTIATAHLHFANFLSTRGRTLEALPEYRRALELDPLSPSINSRLGMELFSLGKRDEGLEYLRKTVELNPWQFNARLRLAWAYVELGDLDMAEHEFAAAERISPDSVRSQAGLAFVAARKGDTARARALLDALLPAAQALDDPLDVAIVYVGLEDRENSIEWLARTAHQTRALHTTAPWGIRAPLYDWLRDDPRFVQIERDVAATLNSGEPTSAATLESVANQ